MDLIRRRAAWPWVAVALGLLLMLPSLLERATVETSNATYEHSMPAEELDALLRAGLDPDRVYGSLTDAGLGSVGLEMETPSDLAADGRLVFLTPSDLLALQLFADEPVTDIPTGDGTFLAFPRDDTWILDRIRAALPTLDVEPVEINGTEFFFASGTDELEMLPIGYDDARIEDLRSRGLDVIARIPETTNPDYIRAELGRIHDQYGINRVMFSGMATPFVGTPAEDVALATWLEDNGFTLLLIELVEQAGVGTYASRMTNVVRLHGMSFVEEIVPQERIDRAVRGLKERNIRVLFYRYTPTLIAEERLGELVDVMAGTNAAAPAGMTPGLAEPFAELHPSPLLAVGGVLASAGIGAAAGAILSPWFVLLGAAGMGLLAMLAAVTGSGTATDLLRLGVAVLFAVAAAFVGRPAPRLGPATMEYAKAGLVTLAGGYVVSGLAFDTTFLTGADGFWGVKALLLAPPALVAVIAAYRVLNRPRWADTVPILQLEVRAWHLAALAVAAGAIAYLTLRSDNTGAAFDIELAFRQELENVLYVRPRTKEFLIGFPALLVGIVLATRTRYAWWLYAVAAIGTASAIDTFSHFHAPLLASTVRTVLGIVIGYAVGLIALWLLGMGERGVRRLGILPRR
jgi:Family of unknown function (DUF5693)